MKKEGNLLQLFQSVIWSVLCCWLCNLYPLDETMTQSKFHVSKSPSVSFMSHKWARKEGLFPNVSRSRLTQINLAPLSYNQRGRKSSDALMKISADSRDPQIPQFSCLKLLPSSQCISLPCPASKQLCMRILCQQNNDSPKTNMNFLNVGPHDKLHLLVHKGGGAGNEPVIYGFDE